MATTQIERLAVLETKVDRIEHTTERLESKVDLLATAVTNLTAAVDVKAASEQATQAAHSTARVFSVVARWGALLISVINTALIIGIAIAASLRGS